MLEELSDQANRLGNRLRLWENDWRSNRVGTGYFLSVIGEILDRVEALLNEF